MLTSTRVYHIFVLLTYYVPNVRRSIWDQCKYVYTIYWWSTSDR